MGDKVYKRFIEKLPYAKVDTKCKGWWHVLPSTGCRVCWMERNRACASCKQQFGSYRKSFRFGYQPRIFYLSVQFLVQYFIVYLLHFFCISERLESTFL